MTRFHEENDAGSDLASPASAMPVSNASNVAVMSSVQNTA